MSKRALVTGGSGGIGQAVCQALGEAGFEVIVHGCTRMDRAEAVAQAIRDKGGNAEALCFDVTDAVQTLDPVPGVDGYCRRSTRPRGRGGPAVRCPGGPNRLARTV